MTEPLFTDDQIPPCKPGLPGLLRRLEVKLADAKARLANAEDPTDDCRCWEAERLELDPIEYEELYNEAQAYRAMEREIGVLERQIEETQEAIKAEWRASR